MHSKHRNPSGPVSKAVFSVLLVFVALLPALPAAANTGGWSDTGTVGVGDSSLNNIGAGRGLICRTVSSGAAEGWGTLSSN